MSMDLTELLNKILLFCYRLTTRKPATTQQNNTETNSAFIKQLDDLFHDI